MIKIKAPGGVETSITLLKNFSFDGTVRIERDNLINIDGSFRYIGEDSNDLSSLKFGVIRGHANFENLNINKLSDLPKRKYANLLTIKYREDLCLLNLMEQDASYGLLWFGHPKKTCVAKVKFVFKIFRKYQELYNSPGANKWRVTLDAQKALIDAGYPKNAGWAE
jgi:hypothetical protein